MGVQIKGNADTKLSGMLRKSAKAWHLPALPSNHALGTIVG